MLHSSSELGIPLMLDCRSLRLAGGVQQACGRDFFIPGTAKEKLPIIRARTHITIILYHIIVLYIFKNLFTLISQIPGF